MLNYQTLPIVKSQDGFTEIYLDFERGKVYIVYANGDTNVFYWRRNIYTRSGIARWSIHESSHPNSLPYQYIYNDMDVEDYYQEYLIDKSIAESLQNS